MFRGRRGSTQGRQAPLVLLLVDLAAGEPLGEQLFGRGPSLDVGVLRGAAKARKMSTPIPTITTQNKTMLTDIANQPQSPPWPYQNIAFHFPVVAGGRGRGARCPATFSVTVTTTVPRP